MALIRVLDLLGSGMARHASLLALALWAGLLGAVDATVDSRPDVHLYDMLSPKLRLTGTGFQEGPVELVLATDDGARVLSQDVDFTLRVNASQLTVLKKPGTLWADTTQSEKPKIFVNSLKVGGVEQIAGGVPMLAATVVPSPRVQRNTTVVFQSDTKKLTLNGRGLGNKVNRLKFDPPLKQGEDYLLLPLKNRLTLLLSPGKKWRGEPGPLYLKMIDTGAGWVRAAPPAMKEGLEIAMVQADSVVNANIHVNPNPDYKVYQTTSELVLGAEGFNMTRKSANLLRFTNGLRGKGINFTIGAVAEEAMTLNLKPGSKWRANPSRLPGPLNLLSANVGHGWVPLGATKLKRGRIVAKVFTTPSVLPGDEVLYRTQSHALTIQGAGFVDPPNGTTKLRFDPPIDETKVRVDADGHQKATVYLDSGAAWHPGTGPLYISAVDTGPGWYELPEKVQVASVEQDSAPHESGVTVTLSHTSQQVYSDQKEIVVSGSNFKQGEPVAVVFKPGYGPPATDFTAQVIAPYVIKLFLNEGKHWSQFHTVLVVQKISTGGQEVPVGGDKGIGIATVFPAPEISIMEPANIYASQSRSMHLHGYFGDELEKVTLSPTAPDAYSSYIISELIIKLDLKPGAAWAAVSNDTSTTVDLFVTSIDLGAGDYVFPEPGIKIAVVHPDSSSVRCDDTCIYANNGACDDGSDRDEEGAFFDDDYGGLYGDDYEGAYGEDYSTDDAWYNYWDEGDAYDDDLTAALCEVGSDCTDCGGAHVQMTLCDDSCQFSNDLVCDDPRGTGVCLAGTDCSDCGPSNGTESSSLYSLTSFDDDSTWYDDDDDDTYNSYEFAYADDDEGGDMSEHAKESLKFQWDGWVAADGKVYTTKVGSAAPSDGGQPVSAVFIILLQALAYTIGAIVIIGGCFVFYQMYKGVKVDIPIPPDETAEELSSQLVKQGRANVPVTPDEVVTNA